MLVFAQLIPGVSGIASNLVSQASDRLERTTEEGVGDSSLQLRYVEGTARFFRYAISDPLMLVVGTGQRTAKMKMQEGSSVEDQMGFVSNGWLLSWRSWGVFGIAGLVWWHYSLFRERGLVGLPFVLVSAIIFASDNYPVETARCFFLIIMFSTAAWSGLPHGPALRPSPAVGGAL